MYQETIQLTEHNTEYAGVSKFRCFPGHRHEEAKKQRCQIQICPYVSRLGKQLDLSL